VAKIDRGREVVDTFYVLGPDGQQIRDEARLTAILAGVRARLEVEV